MRDLLKIRNAVYRARGTAAYSLARTNMKCGIKTAKKEYRLKIEGNFNSITRCLWQDLQSISDYRTKITMPANAAPPLAEA